MNVYSLDMKKNHFVYVCLFSVFVFAFSSCQKVNKVQLIQEDELFTLNYGNFENQLNLFGITDVGHIRTSLTMKDGFFYISNGEAQKIISLNSYGDLLSLYYNEDFYSENAVGIPAKSTPGIWKPVSYPFSFGGKISVDTRKYIYSVGIVPKERNEQDETENLLYKQVVLRFSSDGTMIDYIGQHGPSGTPFPFIRDIYTTENNELVVVCSTNEGSVFFWFAENVFLRYKIPINTKDVPRIPLESLGIEESDLFITVENVIPDCTTRKLYIKLDYYVPFIDSESKVQSGIDYFETLVYPLDVETGVYGEPINIPVYEESVTEDFSKFTYKMPYDFLGVTKNGWLYFIISNDKGFAVQMIDSNGQHVLKRQFEVSHKDTMFYSINLSDEGIISALLARKDKANIVWWRTDSLIASILN